MSRVVLENVNAQKIKILQLNWVSEVELNMDALTVIQRVKSVDQNMSPNGHLIHWTEVSMF